LSFRRHFEIHLAPVAVRFSDEEVKGSEGEYRFCEAVRLVAEKGERIVVDEFNLTCAGALVSLRFITEDGVDETKAIVLEPYEGQECDVVLVVTTPDRVMSISAFYKKLFDEELRAVFSGETAVCGEATALVREERKPNVSFLCPGAREFGGYRRDEVVIGFPHDVFRRIELAIKRQEIKSLCGCLMDDLPKELIERFESMGFDKATDHFMGFVNGKSVKLYVFKGDSNSLGVFTSVKFRSEEEAERVAERYSGNYVAIPRENWVELSGIVDIDVFKDYRRPDFEEIINGEVERLVEEARRLKKLRDEA